MNIFGKTFNKIKNLFTKASRTQSIIVTGSDGAVYSNRDYANFAKESYMKNVIAFRAISIIAKSVASVPWELFRKQGEENTKVNEGPYVDLLKRPNPDDSWSFLMIQVSAYLSIAGNSYIERVGPTAGPNQGIPRELYSLRPDRMSIKVNPETGAKTGYTYTVNGKSASFEIDPFTGESEILHLKEFHPLDDFYGLSTTEPAAREIDSSNEATDFNKNLLQNRAVPGMIFRVVGALSQQQYDRLERRLKAEYSGGVNAGKNLILEGEAGTDAKPYGFSPAEMDFIESNQELARRISYAYGVPPQLVGIPGDNTYSNYQEARLAFWEDTVIPLLQFIVEEFNNWLFHDSDLFYDINLNNVPALSVKRDALWKRAEEVTFITVNEKRKMVGMETVEGGDVILIPANLLPLSAQPTEDEMGEGDEPTPEEEEELEGDEGDEGDDDDENEDE